MCTKGSHKLVRVVDTYGKNCLAVASRIHQISSSDSFRDVFDSFLPELGAGTELTGVHLKRCVGSPDEDSVETKELHGNVHCMMKLISEAQTFEPSIVTFVVSRHGARHALSEDATDDGAVRDPMNQQTIASELLSEKLPASRRCCFIARAEAASWYAERHRAMAAALLADYLFRNGCGFENDEDSVSVTMFKALEQTLFDVTPELKHWMFNHNPPKCDWENECLLELNYLVGTQRPKTTSDCTLDVSKSSVIAGICSVLTGKDTLRCDCTTRNS